MQRLAMLMLDGGGWSVSGLTAAMEIASSSRRIHNREAASETSKRRMRRRCKVSRVVEVSMTKARMR